MSGKPGVAIYGILPQGSSRILLKMVWSKMEDELVEIHRAHYHCHAISCEYITASSERCFRSGGYAPHGLEQLGFVRADHF